MKKLKTFAALALLLMGVAGCGSGTVQPQLSLITVDTTFQEGAFNYRVQYEFTTLANAKASPALEAVEQANIAYFFSLEAFTGTAREAVAEAIAQLVGETRTPDDGSRVEQGGFEASVTVTSEAAVVDTVLVYTIAYASYTGGAHGMYGQSAHNYSISSGYELTLGDLFDEEQRQKLREIIRGKLYREFGVTSDEGLAEQGFFPEYIDVTDNFALTEEGIVFYYNPYDIGCYALGPVEVTIDREEYDIL